MDYFRLKLLIALIVGVLIVIGSYHFYQGEIIIKGQSMNNQIEIWKPIAGYPKYEVSNLGNIKSHNYMRSGKDRNLKFFYNLWGYRLIKLYLNAKPRTFKVHRLVADAFIPNKEGKRIVHHMNEIKTDNRLCNLEWATDKENVNHGTGLKRMADKLRNGPLSKKIKQLTLDGCLVKIWPSQNEAGRNGFLQPLIRKCCIGKRNTHGGYRWEYA